MVSPNIYYPENVVPDNNKAPTLEGEYYTKIGGMWTLNMRSSHQNYMKY